MILTYDRHVTVGSFLPLKMAASGVAVTSGLIGNLGLRPNSPIASINSNDTGRVSLRTATPVRHLYGEDVLKYIRRFERLREKKSH